MHELDFNVKSWYNVGVAGIASLIPHCCYILRAKCQRRRPMTSQVQILYSETLDLSSLTPFVPLGKSARLRGSDACWYSRYSVIYMKVLYPGYVVQEVTYVGDFRLAMCSISQGQRWVK